MIDMHSKYDNMHKNEMVYVLICINNLIISSINYMLSTINSSSIVPKAMTIKGCD